MAQSFFGMASPTDCGLVQDDPILYRARVAPDRPALFEIATGRQLTYAGLDARIARCAGFLTGVFGLRRNGQRVAILARNSIDSIVLAFACQRVGAVYVPLNWRLNAAELRPILADCTPALLIHDEEFAAVAASVAGAVPQMTMMSTTDGPDGSRRADRGKPSGRTGARRRRRGLHPSLYVGHDGTAEGRHHHPPQRLFRRRQFFLRRRDRPRFGCPVRPAVLPHDRADRGCPHHA